MSKRFRSQFKEESSYTKENLNFKRKKLQGIDTHNFIKIHECMILKTKTNKQTHKQTPRWSSLENARKSIYYSEHYLK